MEKWQITLLCGIIAAVVSMITSNITTRFSYKQLFAETVSKSRNKWLNEMRDFISTMLTEVQKHCSNKNAQDNDSSSAHHERTSDYWKARNEIMLRLNLNEPLHLMLKNEILNLDNNSDEKTIENIIAISQTLLKEEWEKVKKEARGK